MTRFSFRAFRFATRCPGGRRSRCSSSPLLKLSATTGQHQRKEKHLNATTTPMRSAVLARDSSHRNRRRAKRVRRPAQIGACTDPPTPVARRATAPERAQRPFLLDRARPVFFSGKTETKMGGASRWTSPPWPGRPIHAPRMLTDPPATAAWTCTGVRPARGRVLRWEWCGAGYPPPPGPGW